MVDTAATVRLREALEQGLVKPTSALTVSHDSEMMQRFLEILSARRVGCLELRVLRAAFDRRGLIVRGDQEGSNFAGATLAGWFDDPARLAGQARRLHGVSGYVSINPVRADLLARSDHRLARMRHTTRDADIVCLR